MKYRILILIFIIIASIPFPLKADSNNWLSERGDSGNSSSIDDFQAPASSSISEIWSFNTRSTIIARPLFYQGKLYICESNALYCVDQINGKLLWQYKPEKNITRTPAIADNTLILVVSNTINAVNASTGKESWSINLSNEILTNIATNGSEFAFGSGNSFFCFKASNGSKKWEFKTDSFVLSTPAFFGNMLYAGSTDKKVRGITIENGKEQWFFNLGEPVIEPIVAFDGRIYAIENNNIYAIESDTGKPRWKYSAIRSFKAPSVNSGKVFAPSEDHYLYCIDANLYGKACCISPGKKLWSFMSPTPLSYPLVSSDKRVFLASTDGILYCISSTEGSLEWTINFGTRLDKILIADGKFIIANSNSLVCFSKTAERLEFKIASTSYLRDGTKLNMDTSIFMDKGTSFVPAKYVIVPFGGTVSYDSKERLVVCRLNEKTVKLWIGKPVAQVDSKIVQISQNKGIVPIIRNGRTLVPIRFISTAFQLLLDFNEKNKTISLETDK